MDAEETSSKDKLMSWYGEATKQAVRHKVFISYHHKNDEAAKKDFERKYANVFCAKSVQEGDIEEDLSADYIARLIRDDYLDDASVCIVLLGKDTHGRKHVDWEIAAALSKKVGGYSGLIGILLPSHPDYGKAQCQTATVPDRLTDNQKSGYAIIYNRLPNSADELRKWIQDAFDARISRKDKIVNNRVQMSRNTVGC